MTLSESLKVRNFTVVSPYNSSVVVNKVYTQPMCGSVLEQRKKKAG